MIKNLSKNILINSGLLIFFVLFLVSASSAQIIKIKDEKTGEPVAFAQITSDEPKISVTTNEKGLADISAFKGASKITISRLGYVTIEISFAEMEKLNFEITMKPAPLEVHEIVVSASRWRQTTREVPIRIFTISPFQTNLESPQTTADLLGFSGKVFIQKSQQAGGSPMFRGFATYRLLYSVDGVRMNNAIFRGGNIQQVISLDPFTLENTEIFFGPGSLIYGSDAIGGVMSFQTIIPKFSLTSEPLITGQAVARFSSANKEKTGHFDVNVGWRKWALVSSVSYFDFDHLRQGSHGPDDYLKPFYVQRIDGVDRVISQPDPQLQIPSAYSQMNLMQKIRFQPNPHWDFQYGFHYSETSPYGRYDRHCRLRKGIPRYAEWDYGPQKWMMNTIQLTHESSTFFYDKFSLRLAQQYFEESRIDRDLNDPIRRHRLEEVDAYSVNLDWLKLIGLKNTFFFGFEYVFNDVTSTGIDENIVTKTKYPGPSRYPQSKWQAWGIYLMANRRLAQNFFLQGGARYSRFAIDAQFDTTFYPFPFTEAHLDHGALTGSLGAVYEPSPSWVITANFATAFRAPNVDDMGKVFDSEPGKVTVPNPNLKAEYAYSADFNLTKVFGRCLKIDLSGYYTVLKNAMVRRDYTLNGLEYIIYAGVLSRVQAIQNAAVANVHGVQVGVEVKLPAGFDLISDFNYQKGEEELDDGSRSPSRHAPPWFGQTRLLYSAGQLNLELSWVYQGKKKPEDMPQEEKGKTEIYALDELGRAYAPSWSILNFKAMYRLSPQVTLTAGIENLTDRRYRPYSSGISGPGRNFLLAVRTSF